MIAADIVKALAGRNGMARCPAHDDKTPSLSVAETDDGKVLLKCFAGCSQDAVMGALTHRRLWGGPANTAPRRQINRRPVRHTDSGERRREALELWRTTQPLKDTLAERYLIGRGLVPPEPSPLRFHPALDYFDTSSPVKLPALVAAVQNVAGEVCGIQRTFLNPAGNGKAQVSRQRQGLGSISAGAVRLAPAAPAIALTEGVEDALALMQMTGAACWALLGTSNFKSFNPPPEIQTIVLAPDADAAGDEIVANAAERFTKMGLKVKHLRPPEGRDWCDVLADFEERAAIREHDAGEDRAAAELAAFAEIVGGRNG